MKKIAMLCPYFGGILPSYYDLFIESCKHNTDVDFYIYTDCKINKVQMLPSHIKVISMTLDELRDKIQAKFDFKIALPQPYQICNFYPAAGIIFEEEFKDYDFWGHCDCDMIFGNLREKITEDILDKYDRIYPWGHLTLYKNTPEVNRRFMLPLGGELVYKETLTSEETNAFDEWGPKGISRIYQEHGIPMYAEHDMANIKIDRFEFMLDSDDINNYPQQVFTWDNGKLLCHYIDNDDTIKYKEYNYIHLQKRSMEVKTQNINKFAIVPNKFIDIPEQGINKAFIHKFGQRKLIYWNNVRRWYQGNVARRAKKLIKMLG